MYSPGCSHHEKYTITINNINCWGHVSMFLWHLLHELIVTVTGILLVIFPCVCPPSIEMLTLVMGEFRIIFLRT